MKSKSEKASIKMPRKVVTAPCRIGADMWRTDKKERRFLLPIAVTNPCKKS